MSEKYNTDSDIILQNLIQQGKILGSDVQTAIEMNKKQKVLKMHPYEISQGKGQDQRWFTYICNNSKSDGRKKVAKKTETLLYDYLYDFYFNNEDRAYKKMNLADLYPEWLNHKNTLTNRSNYVRRISSDYKKYYLNEPLSMTILTKPLTALTKVDIETWAYSIIKKYSLTRKGYYNMSIILRQMLEYLVDKEVLDSNPYSRVKVKPNTFKKERKKPAETQIFYPDEVSLVLERAYALAEDTQDETYLAIPLFFRSGIRIGECLALSYDSFDKEQNSIVLRKSLAVVEKLNDDGTWATRKYEVIDHLKSGHEERVVLVVKECFDILDKIRQIHQTKGIERDLLFHVKTPATVSHKLYRICDQLGIMKRSPHKIRKSYISTLLNSQVDVDFIREQVGHKELSTTLNSYTYSTTRREQQLETLNQLLA